MSPHASAWFESRNLEFAYPGGPAVLRHVSLGFARGSMTAIIGSNGSGKSTLVRLLAGLLKPASGEILLDGARLRSIPPRQRARQIAYVAQSVPAAFPFRAMDVVLSGRTPHVEQFRFESEADRAVALAALESVDAAHLATRSITDLSGGERQLVVLARALAQEPRLLLLDEPSSALDMKHRGGFIRTLARLRESRDLTVVMVTHDLQLTGSHFDRVVAMRCGEVMSNDTPARVLETSQLCAIFDDPNVRAGRMEGRPVIWMEA